VIAHPSSSSWGARGVTLGLLVAVWRVGVRVTPPIERESGSHSVTESRLSAVTHRHEPGEAVLGPREGSLLFFTSGGSSESVRPAKRATHLDEHPGLRGVWCTPHGPRKSWGLFSSHSTVPITASGLQG